jgi:hypothetical protein
LVIEWVENSLPTRVWGVGTGPALKGGWSGHPISPMSSVV